MENILKQLNQTTIEIVFNTLERQVYERRIQRIVEAEKKLKEMAERIEALKNRRK